MYCGRCGKELIEGAIFCGNCGNNISNTSISDSPNYAEKIGEEKKTKNRWIPILISGIAVILISVFLVCYFNFIKPKMALNKLPELSTIERQMNRALNVMFDSSSGHEVSNFEISDAEGENYDKTFECQAMNGHVMIVGQAKDGHVIQIQTIVMFNADDIDDFEETVAALMELSIFQLSLFDDDVNKPSDYSRVRHDLEELDDYGNYSYAGRYVKDDIETVVSGGDMGTTMLILGNVRYLPEFEGGVFDDDVDEE